MSNKDVRMRGFAHRTSFLKALEIADSLATAKPRPETQQLLKSCHRVLAEDVTSPYSVPPFRRSAMDGFAIQAEDSFGASEHNPLPLKIIDEVLPGHVSEKIVHPGQSIRIMTGAPVPEGADAVIRAESCTDNGDQVLLKDSITPGKNVGSIGEDIPANSLVFGAGRRLRPQDIGLLASLGFSELAVHAKPAIRVLATGNELLPPGSKLAPGKIIDSNSPMLAELIDRDGGQLVEQLRLPDIKEVIRENLVKPGADLIIATGGSSVGKEDYLPALVQEQGDLLVHGIALRPAAPCGFGTINGTPVFLLPGNPVSCLCAYDLFVSRTIRGLAGLSRDLPYPRITGQLERKIISPIGRTDYVRVQLIGDKVRPIASSGASILSSTTKADGFLLTSEHSEGLPEGSIVQVFLYDFSGSPMTLSTSGTQP